jgi:hypothetical protein
MEILSGFGLFSLCLHSNGQHFDFEEAGTTQHQAHHAN